MSDEMKKPVGENLAVYPAPRDVTRGLIQAVCHSSVVSYIFLQIQVTEEWSVHLDSDSWRLSQEIPDLRI